MRFAHLSAFGAFFFPGIGSYLGLFSTPVSTFLPAGVFGCSLLLPEAPSRLSGAPSGIELTPGWSLASRDVFSGVWAGFHSRSLSGVEHTSVLILSTFLVIANAENFQPQAGHVYRLVRLYFLGHPVVWGN